MQYFLCSTCHLTDKIKKERLLDECESQQKRWSGDTEVESNELKPWFQVPQVSWTLRSSRCWLDKSILALKGLPTVLRISPFPACYLSPLLCSIFFQGLRLCSNLCRYYSCSQHCTSATYFSRLHISLYINPTLQGSTYHMIISNGVRIAFDKTQHPSRVKTIIGRDVP